MSHLGGGTKFFARKDDKPEKGWRDWGGGGVGGGGGQCDVERGLPLFLLLLLLYSLISFTLCVGKVKSPLLLLVLLVSSFF